MRFTKMNGAGNDFIILNNMVEHIDPSLFPAIARTLCHRRLSIGADGLMVVDSPRQGGDFRMLFYNADGSAGEMCGNGARCICRYGPENGLAGAEQAVETPSLLWRYVERSNVELIRQMTDMITCQRALQSCASVTKMYDEVMGHAASDIGRM